MKTWENSIIKILYQKIRIPLQIFMCLGLSLSLLSCGVFEEEEKEIAEPFYDLLNAFLDEAKHRGYDIYSDHLVMRFGEIDQSDRQIAICVTYISSNPVQEIAKKRSDWRKVFGPGKAPEVIVPLQNWDLLSATQREITIFHELGHCLLGLGHYDDKPAIMNTYIMSSRYYRENREVLIDELFDSYRGN